MGAPMLTMADARHAELIRRIDEIETATDCYDLATDCYDLATEVVGMCDKLGREMSLRIVGGVEPDTQDLAAFILLDQTMRHLEHIHSGAIPLGVSSATTRRELVRAAYRWIPRD